MLDHFGDKEFERLFRKGSEQYDFEYNEEAWNQMEVLLNKQRRKKLLVWWMRFGLILFLLAALWYGIQHTSARDQLKKEDLESASKTMATELHNPENTDPSELQGDISLKDQLNRGGQDTEKSVLTSANGVDIEERSVSRANTSDAHELIPERAGDSKSSIQLPAGQISEDGSLNTGEGVARNESITEENYLVRKLSDIVAGFDLIGEQSKPTVTNPEREIPLNTDYRDYQLKTRVAEPLPLIFKYLRYSEIENSMPHIHLPDAATLLKKEQEAGSASLYLMLHAGTSTSKAGEMGYSDWDWRFGISANYFPKRKVGLSLGVNYISDSYQAGKSDYAPYKGYWTDKVAPDWTDAMCDILEIPVSVSYYPSGVDMNGFFGSAGISSILMLSEAYYYNYEDPQPHYRSSWHGSMDSKDWFSMSEISVGYQWRLSNRSILRVGPYFQIPVRGIGHGNVMLKSFGLSAGYGFGIVR